MANWFKKKMVNISLALANVEKNILNQDTSQGLNVGMNQETRHTKGTLADALVHGERTEEVERLLWRTYKILGHSEKRTTKITGYDANGNPILETIDNGISPDDIKVDEYDSYKLEMVVKNDRITNDIKDIIGNENIEEATEVISVIDKDGDVVKTLGEIKLSDYEQQFKNERPIIVNRNNFSKFHIENYTTKMNVRNIDGQNKLLEFYINKYTSSDDRNGKFFISELKKTIANPITSNMLDISNVTFITNKTIGKKDLLEYEFKINSFDKIVEFDGFYVIKFLAEVTIDGVYIIEKYRSQELEEKYKNREKK